MLNGDHRAGPAAALKVTPLTLARRHLGRREVPGPESDPFIRAWLSLVAPWASDDSVPWCSAFVFAMAWELDLTRPAPGKCPTTGERVGPAGARTWLTVGEQIPLDDAVPGFDVVVTERGGGDQPGPHVLAAPGHVAFFVERVGLGHQVAILGGNQGNSVSVQDVPASRILGVRRLQGAR